MTAAARVGVVGGGILGTVLSLRLAQAGHRVTLLERGPSLGGLAGSMDFGGHTVDRFYHVITPADSRMIALGRGGRPRRPAALRARGRGLLPGRRRLHDLNGLADFLRFSPLSLRSGAPAARLVRGAVPAALGATAVSSDIPLERWLRRHCGNRGDRQDLAPAARLALRGPPLRAARHLPVGAHPAHVGRAHRTGAPRGDGSRDRRPPAPDRRGGRAGGGVWASTRAPMPRSRAWRMDGEAVTGRAGRRRGPGPSTSRSPRSSRRPCASCSPSEMQRLLEAYPKRYLGVVCVVLKVRESVLPYYSLNICEPTPITTVVETSHVVGTDHTDGLRLVYLPRYCDPERAGADRGRRIGVSSASPAMLERVSPTFTRERRGRLDRSARAAGGAGAPRRRRAARGADLARRAGPGSGLGDSRSIRACSTATRWWTWPSVWPREATRAAGQPRAGCESAVSRAGHRHAKEARAGMAMGVGHPGHGRLLRAIQAIAYLSSFGATARTDAFFAAFALYTVFGVFCQSIRVTSVPLLVGRRPRSWEGANSRPRYAVDRGARGSGLFGPWPGPISGAAGSRRRARRPRETHRERPADPGRGDDPAAGRRRRGDAAGRLGPLRHRGQGYIAGAGRRGR